MSVEYCILYIKNPISLILQDRRSFPGKMSFKWKLTSTLGPLTMDVVLVNLYKNILSKYAT